MLQVDRDTERKAISILKVLSESSEPVGSTIIARELESHGVCLSERTIRYHLKMMDERGFTRPLGRDGRSITREGMEELKSALAPEQIGFVIERINLLAYQSNFDPRTRVGRCLSGERRQKTARPAKQVLLIDNSGHPILRHDLGILADPGTDGGIPEYTYRRLSGFA